ncbi:MAG TPA: flagellar biosynthetic protein FliO [Planctomycetota bacterium]|jgi:flagellar biogenesis protein FliO|nr:flagellar biosynthetic protein FliO [Planctomycetota bacterium]
MGLAAFIACVALGAAVQDPTPAPAAESADVTVTLPAPLPAQVAPPAAEPVKPAPALAIPVEEGRRVSKPLEDKDNPGPSLAGFMIGSFAVVGFMGIAFLLLRRFGKNSRLLGSAGAIRVLARKPLGPKQEIFLVEVGPKVFMIGSTRDHLSTLGEFAAPDDVALLRANLPGRSEESQRGEFSQSLREGLRGEEQPREEKVFASIADELAEIRKTVRAWRA